MVGATQLVVARTRTNGDVRRCHALLWRNMTCEISNTIGSAQCGARGGMHGQGLCIGSPCVQFIPYSKCSQGMDGEGWEQCHAGNRDARGTARRAHTRPAKGPLASASREGRRPREALLYDRLGFRHRTRGKNVRWTEGSTRGPRGVHQLGGPYCVSPFPSFP